MERNVQIKKLRRPRLQNAIIGGAVFAALFYRKCFSFFYQLLHQAVCLVYRQTELLSDISRCSHTSFV